MRLPQRRACRLIKYPDTLIDILAAPEIQDFPSDEAVIGAIVVNQLSDICGYWIESRSERSPVVKLPSFRLASGENCPLINRRKVRMASSRQCCCRPGLRYCGCLTGHQVSGMTTRLLASLVRMQAQTPSIESESTSVNLRINADGATFRALPANTPQVCNAPRVSGGVTFWSCAQLDKMVAVKS